MAAPEEIFVAVMENGLDEFLPAGNPQKEAEMMDVDRIDIGEVGVVIDGLEIHGNHCSQKSPRRRGGFEVSGNSRKLFLVFLI